MLNIEITEESKKFLDAVDQGTSPLFLTGKAGTGKSTLLRHMRDNIRRNVAVVAPTGLAALNVGGQTIHSFFRFPVRAIMDKEIIKELYGWPRRMFERLHVLIIDEVSMVRVDTMHCIDQFLRKNARRSDLPFGGVQVIMIGDLFQLPPVLKQGSAEQEWLIKTYGTSFFFGAPVFQESKMQMFELTKVYRQADNEFIECLNQIREGGDAFMAAVRKINDTCFIGEEPFIGVTMVGTNEKADAINLFELRQLEGDMQNYKADRTGSLADENLKEDRFPAPENLRLKVGARVMILRNDGEGRRYVNGTVGTVMGLPDNPMMPVTIDIADPESDDEPEYVYVGRHEWQQTRVELFGNSYTQSVVGTYVQYPLQLAYAMTIHKAQGKTLDTVLLDVGRGMFADGQLYVALSRVKSIQGLKLRKRLEVKDVLVNPDVIDFYDRHHNTERIQGGLFHE